KLCWLLRHEPSVQAAYAAGRLRLGTSDAFFLQHLTGRCATDVTTASRTSLMNIRTCKWDESLCRLFGVPIECLPPIQATASGFASAAQPPITASVVDQQASLYPHHRRNGGKIKFTFGTGAFALALTSSDVVCAPETGLLPTIAWQIGSDAVQYAVD